jgi:hypothetical protein
MLPPGVPAATAPLTAEQVVTELAKRIPTVKPRGGLHR